MLIELDRLEEALASYDKAIEFKLDYAEAFYNRGIVFNELNRLDEALATYEKAIQLKPEYAEAHSNRGNMLNELNRLEEALASYDKAIEFKRDYAEAHSNRGALLIKFKRLEEALVSYDQAIKFKRDYAEAYFNKSLALLLSGDFGKGFDEYEWRWKVKKAQLKFKRNYSQPLWTGKQSLLNKTILLWSEQGLGDNLQFCRYTKLVYELGAKVILEVPKPLFKLLKNLEGVSQLVSIGSALPSFDYQCPILSLPLALNTTIESIPRSIPYISIDICRQNLWRERLGNSGFNIAICWQGSTQGKVDIGRSFPVSFFEGIATINGVRLISLQKNEGIEQLISLPAGMKVELLPDDFDSGDNAFLDSAAVLKCVDLVITSDTALTHLSGALGVMTWLPLQYVPDWRWMLDRSDSPWYPNHRLFRQKTRGDWTGVFKEMENELKAMVLTKHNKSI
jgi:tetratricopeptide (TPR) repeat protein